MRAGCGSNVTATALAPLDPRPPHNLAQHVRVRPVHAVKIAHAHQRRAKFGWNVIEFVKNLHSSGQWPVPVARKCSAPQLSSLTTEL